MKKVKYLLIIFITVFICIFSFSTSKVFAYSEQTRIANEVEDHIEDGDLPEWHRQYKSYPYYQYIYQKFCTIPSSLEYFGNLTETRLRELFYMYMDNTGSWMELLNKLDVSTAVLEPNKTLGIQFDGRFLYLIWTSEYIPNELLNLKSVTYKVNNAILTTNNALMMNTCCSHLEGDPLFELTDHTFIMGQHQEVLIQINKTPIMSYHVCEDDDSIIGYGVNLEEVKNFSIVGWTAEYDHFFKTELDDPTDYYTFSSEDNDEVSFNLPTPMRYGSTPFYEFRTHRSVNITDCICQSIWDLNFGGYKHYVYFNTDINLDKVYRVDCAYMLTADDEIWAAKLLSGVKTQMLHKSLSEDKARGGFLNLSRFQGLTEGDFSSNDPGATHYRYRLMLNYDEQNWNCNEIITTTESDYKRVEEFYALKLDFVYDGSRQEYDLQMDPIEGMSMKFYNRDLILDTSTAIWKFKETTFEVADTTGETITDIIDTTGDVVTGVVDTASELIEDTGDVVSGVVDTAGNVIGGAGDAISSIVDGISNATSNPSKVKKGIFIVGGTILGFILLYLIFKIIRFFKEFLSLKENKK